MFVHRRRLSPPDQPRLKWRPSSRRRRCAHACRHAFAHVCRHAPHCQLSLRRGEDTVDFEALAARTEGASGAVLEVGRAASDVMFRNHGMQSMKT